MLSLRRPSYATSVSVLIVLALFAAICSVPANAQTGTDTAAGAQQAASSNAPTGPRIWLQDNQALPVHHTGPGAGLMTNAQPLAMARGDFDADGVDDLAVGYAAPGGGVLALHRGNLDAFAPQSESSFWAIARGQFPSPFLPEVNTIPLPIRPDFVVVGSYNGEGYPDIIVAQRGDSSIYLLGNNGKGVFSAPKQINVGGPITALAAGEFGAHDIYSKLLVGISDQRGSYLMVYAGTLNGLGGDTVLPLRAAASNIEFGNFGGPTTDAALLAGDQIQVLRASTMQLVSVNLPLSVRAFALGSFIFDRNAGPEFAVAGADGSVSIVARSEFDPRPYTTEQHRAIRNARLQNQAPPYVPVASFPANGWKVVESFPAAAPYASQPPVILRARISINGADDVMVLNSFTGRMAIISHGDGQPGASNFQPGQVSTRPYVGSPVAALGMRVNVDARAGVMALHQGQVAPAVLMPLPDPTFTVNRFDDPTPHSPISGACNGVANDCSLREAILKSNGDTVMVPNGTYTLTIAKVANDCTGNFGALSVERSTTIVGGGQSTTVIQAGNIPYNAGTPNGVDMVMNVNEDLGTTNCPITTANASLSNLTLQNGHNRGTHGFDGDGGCMEFDTGTNGTSTLALTNVTMQNCDTTQGGGGGLVVFASIHPAGGGATTISNSTFQRNSASDSIAGTEGGGIAISAGSVVTASHIQVLNNISNHVVNGQAGLGGGIALDASGGTPGAFGSLTMHASGISNNTAGGLGGGISDLGMSLTIDQGTIISGNRGGVANQANEQDGGGIYLNNHTTDTVTISKVTITGNSATGNGGAIHTGNSSAFPSAGPLTMSFSRLTANTAGGSGSNLSNNGTSVTATNNWWGTNAASSTINTTTTGVTSFDPFIVLTHTATPAKIKVNQSTTLTGDMSKDNHGNGATLSGNLDEIVGLPITFDSPVLGTIPQAQPETLGNPVPTATATFSAGGAGGFGTANATVDAATVAVNSNLIASATESGTTATITTVGAHGFTTGQFVRISGVGNSGYDSSPSTQVFQVLSTPTANTFTYTANSSGLGASSGGLADGGIIILQPPSITKSFGASSIAVNGTTTVSFSIDNSVNVVPINASFTDSLPTGLQVASTPGVTNTCGGTVTATAGAGSISFSNSTLAAAVCSISVNVTGTVDNQYTNSVQVLSTDAGNGNTSSANLTVINPPHIAKAFAAATVPMNGSTALTFTLTSSNQNLTLNGVAFTDALPAGLVVAATPNLNNTCGGTATAAQGASSISLSGASLAPGASCTVSANVTGTTGGVKNNSVQVSSANGGTGNTSNASVTVVGPPTISKAFGASSVPLNGTTSLTFTLTNPNNFVGGDLTGIAFSDTLPSTTGALVVATPSGLVNGCGGTVTATAGAGVISLSGGTLAHGAGPTTCTITVNVTGTAAGDANNTTGAITSTEGGAGAASNTALLKVVAPPTISKAFGASTIPLNGTTTLTFTLTNPAANTTAESGIAFSDTLSNGLQVASTPGVSNTCNATVAAAANSTSISVTGGSIATPGGACTIVVNVTGTQSGTVSNTTGAITSTSGGGGATSNTASLTVTAPPSIAKAFGAATIPLNGSTSLTFTINNPNPGLGLSGVAFTDALPAGLVVASPSGLNNTCGGTATATAGAGSVGLSGGTLASSASCTVSVNVQGTAAGQKNNSVQVTSTEGGTGNTATASVTVVGPPTLAKAFGAASIPLNGSTSLSFTITNPNPAAALSGIAFSDALPAGLVISTPNGLAGSCGGGTITATAGSGLVTLSGSTLVASATCTFSVNVTGTAAGAVTNTSGAITSTEGGPGNTATAGLHVEAPPSIAKAFNPASIALNATTSLTFTITNPAANADALAGVGFSDTLPSGLTVASGTSPACGGTLTTTSPSGIALSGGTVATNSQCQFSVTVTGAAGGQFTNTTGNVTSTNGGTGNTASANLTVASAPSISKAFGAATIALNGTTSLTFNISNPNSALALTGVAFTDALPSGLVVASPSGLNNTCGGTATAAAGSGSVGLSGGTLATSASCTVSVNVQGTTAGQKNNSVQVTSTEAGAGNTATASVTVVGPPTLAKAFGAASIALNGSTSLGFTITNPNPTQGLSGIAFSDTLPAGLVISTPNGLTGSCGGGTITATAGGSLISLSGATLAANGACQFSLNVTGTSAGLKNNTSGAITSTEGGPGSTASASVTVVAPPSIAKAFSPSTIALNATTSLTFTITNPAANTAALSGVAFTDTLPSGLTVVSGTSSVCGGALTTTAPTGISLAGATVAANGQCQFSVTVTGAAPGPYTNTTGAVTSTNGGTGNTASANLSVGTPPTISKAFGAASILLNGATSLTFNISNPNTSLALTGVNFSDSLPAGLQVASPSGLTSSCGGTAAASPSSISLSGGALAANGACSISLNVKGVAAGVQNNTTGPISANETGAGATSNTASVTVVGPPSIAKAFGAASVNLNGTTSLTFTLTNPNATVALAGVAFTDALPAGLAVTSPNGVAGSCGSGTITAVPDSASVSLSGGTIAAGGACSFAVNIVGKTGGHKVNTTGAVSSSNAGSGNQATATLDVNAPDLTITKTHSGNFARGGTGAYTITISNVGFGPTSGTVTMADMLPNANNGFTVNSLSGAGWTCVAATVTCTRTDALPSTAGANSYPAITLVVNVPQNIQANVTNTATVSGGGDTNPNNNSATDQTHIGPPLQMSFNNTSLTVGRPGSASLTFELDSSNGEGAVGLLCTGSGIPAGLACSFTPPNSDQLTTTVTMTVTTGQLAQVRPSSWWPATSPVFGLLIPAAAGLRRAGEKRRKRKAALLLGLLAALLVVLAGCGAHTPPPIGQFVVNVTATSPVTGDVASVPVGVNVL